MTAKGPIVPNLHESDFKTIVEDATWNMARLKSVTVQGLSARATFRSASGKQTWEATYSYEEATGELTCYAPYTDSAQARIFAGNIERGIRLVLNGS